MALIRRDSGTFETPHHEVKGIFFVVARKHLLDRYGVESIDRLAAAMAPEHRSAVLQPLLSSWYREEALQQAMRAFHQEIASGRDSEFLDALEACTIDGVNRFFQLLLGLASPAIVLRKCPVLWRFVRRGPGSVTVEADDKRATVKYRNFPYFEDKTYRLMMEGTLRGVTNLAQPSVSPRVRSMTWGSSSLDVEVVYGL